MIYGIGVDICQISRIAGSLERFGDRFAERILDAQELQDFHASRRQVRFLAMRFAAKEATSKALGTGFKQGVAPRQIGLRHEASGKPGLVCNGRALELMESHAIAASNISLSDEADFAVAFVILETA
jgi:holo-[acyl-carrier protein] synthase